MNNAMDNGRIYSAADLVSAVLGKIAGPKLRETQTLTQTWKQVVFGIQSSNPKLEPNRGENMYAHSSLLDLQNGVLLIETDHPGWNQLFQLYQKDILAQLNRIAPELGVIDLSCRLKKNIGN